MAVSSVLKINIISSSALISVHSYLEYTEYKKHSLLAGQHLSKTSGLIWRVIFNYDRSRNEETYTASKSFVSVQLVLRKKQV